MKDYTNKYVNERLKRVRFETQLADLDKRVTTTFTPIAEIYEYTRMTKQIYEMI